MELLVIRHARAERVKEFAKKGLSDDLRPLTADGRERMRLGVAGLHRLVEEIDVLATSPLVRTRQTAEIIATEFGLSGIIELEELRPSSGPKRFERWLREAGSRELIAIVGHDAQLRALVAWLLTGSRDSIVEIKKGGALLLELRGGGGRRIERAKLLWSVAPRQLRVLGG